MKKGLLTREIHNAERVLDSCDVEELKTLIPTINSAFDKFDNSHTKYIGILDDSEDIERAITYYDDVCIKYRTSLKQTLYQIYLRIHPTLLNHRKWHHP